MTVQTWYVINKTQEIVIPFSGLLIHRSNDVHMKELLLEVRGAVCAGV